MKELLAECLRSGGAELRLFENDDEIVLRHCPDTLLLSVQLTQQLPNKSVLMTWMRLGAISLHHFQGALAQHPTSGELWLVHCLHKPYGEQPLQRCIESLLNQRDTWRATFARLNKPTHPLSPTSLRSLSH
ncbi:type III secretion protein [Pseudomonas sp. R11-23-07]|uniref:type III secretion protein n=2 Tax=unclassified Pseudomonas TaxID=196821 RepID=UPI000F56A52F|nr:type III secretion protein [Pseudomonas sp. R11-23-07]AZF40875.1 type III secretion protein HrpG [Pseudomonas sp. R1-43-08]AZF56626.1 type III secretion protein HrpG [Pseudomonas sp. R11-23-07]